MTGRKAMSAIGWLQCGFVCVFVALGWAPVDRSTWLIENSLVVVGGVALLLCRRQFYWSTRSWALVLLFLCAHEVGTHYTYPEVPYPALAARLWGWDIDTAMGWDRNQYDRFVHLLYGLCTALPFRELITVKCRLKGAWASLMAWSLVLATSMLYELMEWLGSGYTGGGNSSFVGAQNDFWDAQKDMAVAAAGSLLVLVCRGHTSWIALLSQSLGRAGKKT